MVGAFENASETLDFLGFAALLDRLKAAEEDIPYPLSTA